MPLKSLDVQAAAAKYRRGGPPAVIARHSSLRERRAVCTVIIHVGPERGEEREGACCNSPLQRLLCYFFHHFCNLPLSHPCMLFCTAKVRWTHRDVAAATFFRAAKRHLTRYTCRCAYNDRLNYSKNNRLYSWNRLFRSFALQLYPTFLLCWFSIAFNKLILYYLISLFYR